MVSPGRVLSALEDADGDTTILIPQRGDPILHTYQHAKPKVSLNYPQGLPQATILNLKGGYEAPPGIIEADVLQDIQLTLSLWEVDRLVY